MCQSKKKGKLKNNCSFLNTDYRARLFPNSPQSAEDQSPLELELHLLEVAVKC